MFSLQKFFCRDERFFDLIEALAQSSSSSVKSLAQALVEPETLKSVDEIVQKRRKSKELNDEISHQLCISFITPFDREDIEALSSALTKISKTAEKFLSQFFVFQDAIQHENFKMPADYIKQSADILIEMVKQLRRKPDVEAVKEMNSELAGWDEVSATVEALRK